MKLVIEIDLQEVGQVRELQIMLEQFTETAMRWPAEADADALLVNHPEKDLLLVGEAKKPLYAHEFDALSETERDALPFVARMYMVRKPLEELPISLMNDPKARKSVVANDGTIKACENAPQRH